MDTTINKNYTNIKAGLYRSDLFLYCIYYIILETQMSTKKKIACIFYILFFGPGPVLRILRPTNSFFSLTILYKNYIVYV